MTTYSDDFQSEAAQWNAPFKLHYHSSIDSTNTEAKRLVCQSGIFGQVIVAEHQTHGRGRRENKWLSDEGGKSLLCSIVWQSQEPMRYWSRLSLATGLAIAEASAHYVPDVKLKWPNDVLWQGLKLGGILIETHQNKIIVGFGINVNQMHFPQELQDKASSLALASGKYVESSLLLSQILHYFQLRASQIGSEFPLLLNDYRSYCALTGRMIQLTNENVVKTGEMLGVSDEGELMLKHHDGTIQHIHQAHDIRVV